MSRISTYTSSGEASHRINDKMTATFVKFEEGHKGVGRGLLGLVQIVVGVVYPLFKLAGAVLPLPFGQKYRWVWAKEGASGLSYIKHGFANLGIGLVSFLPRVNADRFRRIEYAYQDRNKILRKDAEYMYKGYENQPDEQEQFLYHNGDLPKEL